MRLSIGVPAFNQGSFLRETLDSLLDQVVPFHEIVVSNNHSTDSTADVLSAFAQQHPGRIRILAPPEHLHAAAHWNFLARSLTGDWISLMSSDDLALPNFVRSVTAAAALSPSAVLVRGAWRNIDATGAVLEERHLISVAPVTHPPKTIYEQRLGPKGSFAAFALRRDIFEKVSGFPEEVSLVADWGMWLLAGACGDFVYTDDILAAYRVGHQEDVHLGRYHAHIHDLFQVYQRVLPRATQTAGLETPGWIQRASRATFRESISAASREIPPAQRALIAEAFRPWAEATGELTRFRRFESGATLRNFHPGLPARLLARRIVSAIRRPRSIAPD